MSAGEITIKVLVTRYSPTTVTTVETLPSLENVKLTESEDSILWLDVSDYKNAEELDPLKKICDLHPLALDDCTHLRQRPKVEDYGENAFFISRLVSEEEVKYSEGLQLGIFLGKNFIVTLHNKSLPQLAEVLGDIRRGKPQLVEGSPSFLLYTLLDKVVDNLEDAIGKAEETESTLGDEVLKENPPENVLGRIYTSRSNLLFVRRLLRPQSDVMCQLIRGDIPIVDKRAELFIRDIYDHTLRTLERIDSLLDINMGSLSIYSSSAGNRMNETMRLLTIISTIGVPLTILVGWYGMNFREMPEIYSAYGYIVVILAAIMIILGSVLLFKRKGWF